MLVSAASRPNVESDGETRELDADMTTVSFGPFIDVSFDPRGGSHVGGAVGQGLGLHDPSSATDSLTRLARPAADRPQRNTCPRPAWSELPAGGEGETLCSNVDSARSLARSNLRR